MTNLNPSYNSLKIYNQFRVLQVVYRANKSCNLFVMFVVIARILIVPSTFHGPVFWYGPLGQALLQGKESPGCDIVVNYRSWLSNVKSKSDTHQTSLTLWYCGISPAFGGHLNVIKQILGKSPNLHTAAETDSAELTYKALYWDQLNSLSCSIQECRSRHMDTERPQLKWISTNVWLQLHIIYFYICFIIIHNPLNIFFQNLVSERALYILHFE